jgi:hypothetical protein
MDIACPVDGKCFIAAWDCDFGSGGEIIHVLIFVGGKKFRGHFHESVEFGNDRAQVVVGSFIIYDFARFSTFLHDCFHNCGVKGVVNRFVACAVFHEEWCVQTVYKIWDGTDFAFCVREKAPCGLGEI